MDLLVLVIEYFARWLAQDGLKGPWMMKCTSVRELDREAGVWRRAEHGLL